MVTSWRTVINMFFFFCAVGEGSAVFCNMGICYALMNASSLAVLQKKHNGASQNVNKSFNLALPRAKLKSHVYLSQEIIIKKKNPVGQWYFPFNPVWRSIVATSCVGSVSALNMRGGIRPLLPNWPGAARHRPAGSGTRRRVISCSYAKPRLLLHRGRVGPGFLGMRAEKCTWQAGSFYSTVRLRHLLRVHLLHLAPQISPRRFCS